MYSADPVLIKVIVSSAYHFQQRSWSFRMGTRDLSKSTMIIPARTGAKGEPIDRFYGAAKISNDDNVEKLPIRPIISNIGTAAYHLAKYLSKLISPLSSSEYTVSSTKNFVRNIQTIKVPRGYHMVSFDVKSLFTNVPLEYTIDLVLKRIYDNGERSTSIIRSEMKLF